MFVLRALQIGLTLPDLDFLEYSDVTNLLIERGNDDCEYTRLASQEDMDRF